VCFNMSSLGFWEEKKKCRGFFLTFDGNVMDYRQRWLILACSQQEITAKNKDPGVIYSELTRTLAICPIRYRCRSLTETKRNVRKAFPSDRFHLKNLAGCGKKKTG